MSTIKKMDSYGDLSRINSSGKCEWRSAVDTKSNRTYYYHIKTKETTWTKPLELATPEERHEMITKRNEALAFFREMEFNIKRKIALAREEEEHAKLMDYYYDRNEQDDLLFEDDTRDMARVRFNSASSSEGKIPAVRSRKNSFSGGPPRRVRTISTMDDEILTTLRLSQKLNVAEEKSNLSRNNSYGSDAKNVQPVSPSTAQTEASKLPRKRRNSTGTIYIASTMSQQDNTATIHCVCAVIHAHMVSAAKENIVPLPEYDVFKDIRTVPTRAEAKDSSPLAMVPSLQTVKDFFTYIFTKSQLESDCIIMALIYCERLVKETKGRLCIRFDNWKSILFACLVMASKVWDDLSMWNVDFSQVYSSFDLARINELELAMLGALRYVIRVTASEYAKYYFLLRGMMVKFGLTAEHRDMARKDRSSTTSSNTQMLRPLDISGAKRLQLSTERLQELSSTLTVNRRRHNSVHETNAESLSLSAQKQQLSASVGLEQLMHSEHVDADGEQRSLKRKPSSNAMKSPKKSSEQKD